MKVFTCQNCGQLLHFENVVCMRCGMTLGFLPDSLALSALDLDPSGDRWTARADGAAWRQCRNLAEADCNWMVPADADDPFCPSCDLNRTIPDLSAPGNQERWQALETAKRRLVYALKRFGLPLAGHKEDVAEGLAFDFLAEADPSMPVLTGHDDGLITINIAEADSAEREKRRLELGEPYRTLLGHLRHEVGHYYWDLLVRDGGRIDACRAVFGDESADYQAALEQHYQNGAPAGWQESYVSAYATMHPWEDFAETWTHYLHMVDTLDTAASFGMVVDPGVSDDPTLETEIAFDPYRARNFDRLIKAWLPLTVAVNSLNRSMGQPDLYPFALTPATIDKLRFIHDLVHGARA
ncbi:MAG: putative zinc-binding peptidase [Amaricoccus sp.]